jgi:acyl carrier protein
MSFQEEVIDFIAKSASIDKSKITPESTLKDLGVDSIDAVQIIFDLEDHYKVTLPDRDPNFELGTVAGLIVAVEHAIANPPAKATVAAPPTA